MISSSKTQRPEQLWHRCYKKGHLILRYNTYLGCTWEDSYKLFFSCLIKKPNKPKKAKDLKLQ